MKRWMSGWMVAGAMVLGTAALAQDTGSSSASAQGQAQDKSVANDNTASPPRSAGESSDSASAGKQDMGTGGAGHQMGTAQQGDTKSQQATAASGSSDPLASAKQLLGQDEKGLMQRMHHENKSEVELSQLALHKSQNKDVQKLAQMLVDDHTKADQQLMQLAQKAGNRLDESEPSAANDTERAVMASNKALKEKLQALEGKAFDQAWLSAMVDDHDMALAKNMAALEQFKSNKELTQMLTPLAPKLKHHREMAYDALGKAKPNARQARSGKSHR